DIIESRPSTAETNLTSKTIDAGTVPGTSYAPAKIVSVGLADEMRESIQELMVGSPPKELLTTQAAIDESETDLAPAELDCIMDSDSSTSSVTVTHHAATRLLKTSQHLPKNPPRLHLPSTRKKFNSDVCQCSASYGGTGLGVPRGFSDAKLKAARKRHNPMERKRLKRPRNMKKRCWEEFPTGTVGR
ncbi:unnamed protein product, partial [Chrysoparadoxa australica]